jgi:hypothetical protein
VYTKLSCVLKGKARNFFSTDLHKIEYCRVYIGNGILFGIHPKWQVS